MIDFILEPLQYPFMQRALTASVLVGVVCALVGTYVVLRGMAFFGDALAHTILPGVAAGYVLGGGAQDVVFWSGMGTAILAALGIGAVSRGAKLREDTAIGIIFAGMFALGIAIISSGGSYAVDLTHFLFGDVLGVSSTDLTLTAVLGGLVVLMVVLFYKEFMVLSFDSVLAVTLRLPARFLENLLLVMIAVTIVVSLNTVGIALMVAMLVTPAATAFLITKRMHWMMVIAAVIASLSGVIGLYVSFYWEIPPGPAIVLTCTVFFMLVWAMQALGQRISST